MKLILLFRSRPCLLSACLKPKPLGSPRHRSPFLLTAQDGQPFESKWLDGHIWVADFIYTTCDGPCPMMSSQMRRIQDQTAAEMPDVRFISITVDPVHDTPPVLLEYAKHFKADFNRWRFLTGDQSALNDLALKGFKLNTVDGSLTHSTRFVLVDGKPPDSRILRHRSGRIHAQADARYPPARA